MKKKTTRYTFGGYDSINVRRDAGTAAKVAELAEALSELLGVRVERHEAVHRAVTAELERVRKQLERAK